MLNLLKELKCNEFVIEPNTVHLDNQSAINRLKEAKFSNKTRQVNLKFHFVRDLIETNYIQLKHISTDLMIVDFLINVLAIDKLLWSM